MSLHRIAVVISVLGAAVTLFWIGIFKFTPTEAKAIQPLISNSPLTSWMQPTFGVQGASNAIGIVEIITALLLACIIAPKRPFQKIAAFGGSLAALTFLCTLSFLATTPGAFSVHDGVMIPDAFILKDVVLLGASLLCISEALRYLRAEPRGDSSLALL